MKQRIINYIRAGYPGPYLVSPEERRVAVEMTQIAKDLKYNLVFWSAVDGLVDVQKNSTTAANDPLEALIAIRDLKEKTLILLRDFLLFLQDPNPILIRQLKDVLQEADQVQDPHHLGLPYDPGPRDRTRPIQFRRLRALLTERPGFVGLISMVTG